MNNDDGSLNFDFVVLGGGSAGYAAARTAVGLGLKTAVIDGADQLGGLCILRGCMPSKALIASADTGLRLRRAGELGITAAWGGADLRLIRDRKRALIADFAGYRRDQLTSGRFELIRGTARFAGTTRLVVTKRDGGAEVPVEFRTCLIATGSTVAVPDIPGLRETGFWTSDTVLDADAVPESIIVLGGGAIALEMAHYLDGIGRRVSVIQRSAHLLTGMDAEVADAVRDAFNHRGIKVACRTRLLRVETTAEGRKAVVYEQEDTTHTQVADEILLALGRRPATEALDLPAAGVEMDGGRVAVLPTQQTSQPHLFAAGDVCGPLEVVHLAIQQGEIAARNAAAWLRGEKAQERMDYRLALFGVFTHPQAAQVGLTEAAAARDGRPVRVAHHPFADHGKSMVMGETDGFVKLIADPETGEILGASVVGPEAVELIHPLVVAMHFHCTTAQFLTIPLYHPTLSEIWSYPAEEIEAARSAS